MSESFPRKWRSAGLVLTVLLAAGVLRAAQQESRPVFRAGVDLIAVDVQVVDTDGLPITGLAADKFDVSINRHRRKVVSADLIRYDDSRGVSPKSAGLRANGVTAGGTSPEAEDGRVFVIAIDLLTFPPTATRDVRTAARRFVDGLRAADQVGLAAYPMGPNVNPSTDRSKLIFALEKIIGQNDGPAHNTFQLTPADIVDLNIIRGPNDRQKQERIANICEWDRDPLNCSRKVEQDARALAILEEVRTLQRVDSFRAMLEGLSASPRRKTIVLVSAGMMDTDVPGGRPDLEDLGLKIGQDAARANATIYTLHVDRDRMALASASSQRRARPGDNPQRDTAIMAKPLDQIAAASGGTLLTIVQGGGEFAFDRVLNETSSYYLLGVEPDEADRDGRPRQLSVKVDAGQRGVSVRARTWVVVPKRSGG